jgi:hypothetical protein
MGGFTIRSSILGARRIFVRIAGRPVLFREAHCLKDAWGYRVNMRSLVAHLEN